MRIAKNQEARIAGPTPVTATPGAIHSATPTVVAWANSAAVSAPAQPNRLAMVIHAG